MIRNQPTSLKKTCLWCLIVICAMIAIGIVFVSFVSLWTGFTHMRQQGFWVPVMTGAVLLTATVFLFIRATKRILHHMKEEDVLNV